MSEDIRFISACLGCTGAITGADRAPKAILSAVSDLISGAYDEMTVEDDNSISSMLDKTIAAGTKIKNAVYDSFKAGIFPFVLGGDHSISLGSIGASMSYYGVEDLGVIYVDAHTDINTFQTSMTGNIHGMCLGSVLGVGDKALINVAGARLRPENLLYLGARSIDPGEKELIDRLNISVISSQTVMSMTDAEITDTIRQFIRQQNIKHIHLSVDIDVLDPSFGPATGVPEAGGITPDRLRTIIAAALESDSVCCVDLVEYNPVLDNDGRTLKCCVDIVRQIVR